MPVAEGKFFDFSDVEAIRSDLLETIKYSGVKQRVTYETEEFSAVCPFSGLPDIARITIEYIPADKIVELKSLKYYFISFRNVGIYQEAVTSRIYTDIISCLEPEFLEVKSVYNIRGGILSTCVVNSESMGKSNK